MNKLHKIVYDGFDYPVYQTYQWCNENCEMGFYHSPRWLDTTFLEFQSQSDAIKFWMKFGQ